MDKLPDFFIVGAAKGATTSLHWYLKQHPKIFLPERKELYCFAFDGKTPRFKLADGKPREPVGVTWDEYYDIYANAPAGCLAGDTSSWYLYYHKEVIETIRQRYGARARELKIVMVLRGPVDRAWSHYCMHRGQGLIDLPFSQTIKQGDFRDRVIDRTAGYYPGYDYIGFGMYAEQVKAYLDAFDRVKIFLYEDFSRDSQGVVREIFQFLDLEPLEDLEKGKRLNVSGAPRSAAAALVGRLVYRPYLFKKLFRFILPPTWRYRIKTGIGRFLFKRERLDPGDRQALIDMFRPDILRLQELIDRDLSVWF
jgi:hypothetical protein